MFSFTYSTVGCKTRSGNEFSPFTFGPPVHVTTDFDITQALYSHNIQMMADEDDGVETEDGYEIEMPPSPSELTSTPLPNVTSHSPSTAPFNTMHPET
jgi:hypothetical protein